MEELLQKVITKVYQLNQKTEHDIFFSFSGHTNTFDIFYYKNGWAENKNLTRLAETTITMTENNLKKALERLEEIEKEG